MVGVFVVYLWYMIYTPQCLQQRTYITSIVVFISALLFIVFVPQPADAINFSSFFTEVKTPTTSTYSQPSSNQSISEGGITTPTTSNCFRGFCKNVSPICPVSAFFTRSIHTGDSGVDVIALQDFLIGKGFLIMPVGTVKGYFGLKTSTALSRYQQTVGLSSVGYLDVGLVNKLNSDMIVGKECFSYVAYDRLSLAFKSGVSISYIAPQLTNLGFISESGIPLCVTNTYRSTCMNGYYGTFKLVLPKNTQVAKVAAYLASLDIFSTVAYVPATLDYIARSPVLTSSPYTVVSTSTKTIVTTTLINATSTVATTTYTLGSAELGINPTQQTINNAVLNTSVAPDSWVYGTWKLTRAKGVDVVTPFGQKPILINIDKGAANLSVVAINACNQATSTARIFGNVISAVLPSPTVYCNATNDGFEGELRTAFSNTASFTVKGVVYKDTILDVIGAYNGAEYLFVRNQ